MHEGLRPNRIAARIAASCVAAAAAFGAAGHVNAAPAPTPTPNVIGPMSSFQYLLGSWSCTGTPKTANSTTNVTYSLASHNTMQFVSKSATTSTLGFYGYDAVAKLWWSASVDNDGVRYYQTSNRWVYYNGTMETGADTFPLRSKMTRLSDTKYRTVTEQQIDGSWVNSGDTTCAKR